MLLLVPDVPCSALSYFSSSAHDIIELLLNNTWRPQLAVTGADGFPAIKSAGNVLRPYTAVKLSIRLPPTADAMKATAAVKELLEKVRGSPLIGHFGPASERSSN